MEPMKFELIESAVAGDVPERAADLPEEADGGPAGTDADPVAAVGAAAAALGAAARAEGRRIEASLAELAAVVHGAAPPGPVAGPPPGDFRPDRFSKGDAR